MTRRARKGLVAAAVAVALTLECRRSGCSIMVERVGISMVDLYHYGGQPGFIASSPTKSEGQYTRRGNVFSIVTLRPADSREPEVSFIAGYTFKPDSTVEVVLDDQHRFSLFTQDDAAWLPNEPQIDRRMIERMRAGLTMVVRGTSSRGTLTTDTYSLRGFTAAYEAMQRACS